MLLTRRTANTIAQAMPSPLFISKLRAQRSLSGQINLPIPSRLLSVNPLAALTISAYAESLKNLKPTAAIPVAFLYVSSCATSLLADSANSAVC